MIVDGENRHYTAIKGIPRLLKSSNATHKGALRCMHKDAFCFFVLTETKLDDTFPTAPFLVNDFSEPDRLDRNRKGGGIMVYIREDISSKL